ncbi:UbiD family decarboxylase [Pelagibacterium sediminicola]|uniref:UbiD family decarboxylase n=1 Tax=Pelagibacterium sediminicola TaxID=2248761 RepID=UPI000E3199E6|nr:UbiD family decarboxylase [Pelagibacterium sediminicola]
MSQDNPVPRRSVPGCANLGAFVDLLERRGRLRRVTAPVSVVHEITEIHRRVLAREGPALLFERPVDAEGRPYGMPLLANLFGTEERIAWGMGLEPADLSRFGTFLADLRQPSVPRSLSQAMEKAPLVGAALTMRASRMRNAPVHQRILIGEAIDLGLLPVQWCWPGEPAPLITWPLVITRAPDDPADINVGVYRMQVLGRDRLIVRWLANRGGARHYRLWQARGEDMPIAIAIGADPATILAAVMPLPDGLSELAFSGLLRGARTPLTRGRTVDLPVPAEAEIVLEGRVSATETAPEGPYGDHTGYYNSVEPFPVVTLDAITMRKNPVYLSTYTGRPPDEPSRLGEALNALFVPLVRRQFPEIVDLWLPPEACSYRMMVVSIDKRYPGQARRVMMGLWSMLPQFSYCKLIVAVDPDIDVRQWPDVIWALSTRFEAPRDLIVIENTPMDYLDFASAEAGLGSKMGLDATTKIGPETSRVWGTPLAMSDEVTARVDTLWAELGLEDGEGTENG